MTDFNKLADALRSPNKAVRVCATMEAESILRAAAGVDVAGLMALVDEAIDAAKEYGEDREVMRESEQGADSSYMRKKVAALESALRLVLAQRVPTDQSQKRG